MHIYREYDIRGVFGDDLNEDRVKKIGYYLGQKIKQKGLYVVVSYDARTHSPLLCDWLGSGLIEAGLKVLDAGLVPTPVSYFCQYHTFVIEGQPVRPAGSIQITGSHNPPKYNGFKITIDQAPFFGKQIEALGQEVEGSSRTIVTCVDRLPIDAIDHYNAYIIEAFEDLRGFDPKIVLDCGNGAAAVAIEPILKALEIPYVGLYCEPDGTFPNHHPDPSEEENLRALKMRLAKGERRYGFAFDGDGDRIAFLSSKYNFKGDILALFFAQDMVNPTVIGEVKCSSIMYDEINKIGQAIMYKTGHSNLKKMLKQTGADLAAEVSGHLFFNDTYFGYDDAIYAMMRLLRLLKKGFDFDRAFEALPQLVSTDEIKIETTEEKKFTIIEALKALILARKESLGVQDIITIDGIRVIFEQGWALVRASNTTPVLVTRFEADSQERLSSIQKSLLLLLREVEDRLG